MWGIPFRRQAENTNDNDSSSIDFYIYSPFLFKAPLNLSVKARGELVKVSQVWLTAHSYHGE